MIETFFIFNNYSNDPSIMHDSSRDPLIIYSMGFGLLLTSIAILIIPKAYFNFGKRFLSDDIRDYYDYDKFYRDKPKIVLGLLISCVGLQMISLFISIFIS